MQPHWLGVAALGLGSLGLCSPPAGSPGQPPETTECRALGRPCADPSPFQSLPACGFPPSAPFPEQFSQRKSPESTSGGLECVVPPPEPKDGHPLAPWHPEQTSGAPVQRGRWPCVSESFANALRSPAGVCCSSLQGIFSRSCICSGCGSARQSRRADKGAARKQSRPQLFLAPRSSSAAA